MSQLAERDRIHTDRRASLSRSGAPTVTTGVGGSLLAGATAWPLCMPNPMVLTYFAHLVKPTPVSWNLFALPLLGVVQWLFIVSFPGRVIVRARLVARAYLHVGLTLQGALTIFYLNGGWIA